MNDLFGRLIRPGDLVASKSSGRYSTMSYGIALGEGKVRFSSGSKGGASDQVIMSTEDPFIARLKKDLENKFIEMDIKKEEAARKKRKDKLRKSQLVRFGVYSQDREYNLYVNLGPAKITTKDVEITYDNLWVSCSKEAGGEGRLTPENISIEEVTQDNCRGSRRIREYAVAKWKYPSMYKEHFIFKREALEKLLDKHIVLL